MCRYVSASDAVLGAPAAMLCKGPDGQHKCHRKKAGTSFHGSAVSLFRQLENSNGVAVRKSHLEIATRGDGDVLDAIHHIRDGRRVDTRTQIELPELRAARGIKRVEISVAFSHEH